MSHKCILIGPFLLKTMTKIEDKNIPTRRGQHLIQVQSIYSLPFVTTTKKNTTTKAFQSEEEWHFLFLNIFSHSRDIQVVNRFSKKIHQINHKIKNISGNIEVMLLKLGSSFLLSPPLPPFPDYAGYDRPSNFETSRLYTNRGF